MITMVAFTTERGNPNKIGFNLIYLNVYIHYKYTDLYHRRFGCENSNNKDKEALRPSPRVTVTVKTKTERGAEAAG